MLPRPESSLTDSYGDTALHAVSRQRRYVTGEAAETVIGQRNDKATVPETAGWLVRNPVELQHGVCPALRSRSTLRGRAARDDGMGYRTFDRAVFYLHLPVDFSRERVLRSGAHGRGRE